MRELNNYYKGKYCILLVDQTYERRYYFDNVCQLTVFIYGEEIPTKENKIRVTKRLSKAVTLKQKHMIIDGIKYQVNLVRI